ncbi:hypothetical protein [Pseudomonas sp. GD03944]|uniref:hypothetical protein n=1 Tax=Pseudomonas sp. GD03944 TaxID=2975409 RepID=UPI0024469165|nr:hypothetical protein [Pseudomonas sp. GD03944]MDH1262925.1 DUF4288 domain-containing protein [Pseudomonas sp. GD03944]
MPWYAVRNVYLFGKKNDGKNIFEERIVCFEAPNFETAHLKGAQESAEYAECCGFVSHSEQFCFLQDGEDLIDGYEVWSELYESNKNLATFYADRYSSYEYIP